MLGRLFRVLVCFLLAMQPASRSLSTDLYYRLAETGQPVLVTLVDTAAAELANSARISEIFDTERPHDNITDIDVDFNNTPVISETERNSAPALNDASVNESQKDFENNQSSFKEITERSTDIFLESNTPGTVLSDHVHENVRGDNNTSPEAEIIKKPDAIPQASEPQEEIPSFSEWAQKQLEEAEKNKENVLNHSSQTTQGTVTSTTNLKVRSKNYASPDCGAKIIAANPEAGSAEFILSPGKDEYMLNTCNSRIWFIVELCEAIQAKKVDLANFELFSSTPKNFSVFVSDRFPTRDWAAVGQFIAKDERDVQTFNLHPHLFGKFVKVEMHSYYGSEHYCPISLFRVYGTSEFEVFETENSPHSQSNQGADDDDDDDEEVLGLADEKKGDVSRNLFGSARDAVMSIMKKAAQVLVKSGDSKNSTVHQEVVTFESRKCRSPSHIIVCDNCSNSMFTDVYDLMSCHGDHLKDLMQTPTIHNSLCNTDICQQYGLDFKSKRTLVSKTKIASYISALFMPSYVAALCNMLAIIEKKVVLNTSYETDLNITSNLTIDKKTEKGTIAELLQDPFATCNSDDATGSPCKESIKEEPHPDIVPLIESSAPLDIISGTIADIKPTKTLQKDSDSLEPSVITIQTSSESHLVHNVNSQSSGFGIEASIKSNADQVSTETLSTKEPEKIHINESLKEIVPETMTLEPDKEKPEFSSVTVNQDNVNDVEGLTAPYDSSAEDVNVKLSTQDQLSLDKLLSELEQGSNDPATPAPPHSTVPTLHQGQGQKESVFLRLSNRIKALERNMSLSGQYLEELSRRYKKQVEEMQKTFEKTLHTMNEESKKSTERDQKNTDEMLLLQQQLAQISSAVSVLLTERDSWFGNASLLKMMIFQIFITVLVTYIFRRNRKAAVSETNSRSPKKDQPQKTKMRRRSDEGAVGHSGTEVYSKKRRPSEEALHIARIASDISAGLKVDKKKRKRKSSILQRSYSAVTPAETEMSIVHPQLENEKWERPDNVAGIDFPVALDEAEFIVPEVDPIDFNRIGELPIPRINGLTPKKEFPKTNGSIFGNKSNDRKTGKVRRLSSPAFFKSALGRQSVRSISNDGSVPTVTEDTISPRDVFVVREIRSEERQVRVGSESPQLSIWSSIGDVSQTGSSAPVDQLSVKNKRSKGKAFKNLFKKVF